MPLFCSATPHFSLTSIGAGGLIVILICIQGILTLLYAHKKYYSALIVMLLLTVSVYAPHHNKKKPGWLKNIGVLSVCVMPRTNDPWQRACDILHQLEWIKKINVTSSLIIGPESTFTWPLNQFASCINRWSTFGLDEKTSFIIGTHRTDNKKQFNSAVLLKQSRITQIYDKRFPLICTERPPQYCNFTQLCSFFTTKNGTCQGEGDLVPFYIEDSEIPPLTPLICSELFFSYEKPIDCSVVLNLVNDSWFSTNAPRHLLYALARLNALIWNVDILYVSHYFGKFISSAGQVYELQKSTL
jgi:apolipoprotein N-acyltransferase